LIGEVDIGRVVWDPEYRRLVMAFLNGRNSEFQNQGGDRRAVNDNAMPDAMSRSGASGGRTPPDH